MNDTKFESWMKEVNAYVQARIGLTADDLPDCCYRDWFDDGVEPKEAARNAIKAAKGEEEF